MWLLFIYFYHLLSYVCSRVAMPELLISRVTLTTAEAKGVPNHAGDVERFEEELDLHV